MLRNNNIQLNKSTRELFSIYEWSENAWAGQSVGPCLHARKGAFVHGKNFRGGIVFLSPVMTGVAELTDEMATLLLMQCL